VTEVADQVARMCDAVDVPLVADIDTGFGNAINARRTVSTFERAGVAAVQIEDQVFPKRCGHFAGKDVVPVGEMRGKLRAVLDARRPSLVVIARTDALAVDGLDAAVERANVYAGERGRRVRRGAADARGPRRPARPRPRSAPREHGRRRRTRSCRRRSSGRSATGSCCSQHRPAGRRAAFATPVELRSTGDVRPLVGRMLSWRIARRSWDSRRSRRSSSAIARRMTDDDRRRSRSRSILRGGTSRGVFFLENDLPSERRRSAILLTSSAARHPPDRRARRRDVATSRRRSSPPGAGRRHRLTFAQVSVTDALSTGAATAAASARPSGVRDRPGSRAGDRAGPTVRIHNTNTAKVIVARVPTANGRARSEALRDPGVRAQSAQVLLEFDDPAGSVTGSLLPTGGHATRSPRRRADVPAIGRRRATDRLSARRRHRLRGTDCRWRSRRQPTPAILERPAA
jgi:hypothetical protein